MVKPIKALFKNKISIDNAKTNREGYRFLMSFKIKKNSHYYFFSIKKILNFIIFFKRAKWDAI